MKKTIENIGKMTISFIRVLLDTLSFSTGAISKMFKRKTYSSASRMILSHQIYFTSVEILPLLLFIALITGIVLIGFGLEFIKELGFTDVLLRILMAFIISEFAPLTTTILVALRSSAAMNTEIAVMKVNGELRSLEMFNINLMDYLFIPRILSGMISLVLLSSLFVVSVLTSGLIFSKIFFGIALNIHINLLLNATEISDIVLLFAKSLAFGFFITLIPIRFGLQATNELTSIPVSVLNGMLKVFIAIVIIEVLALIPRFI